jgi:hypothetical protein
MHEVPELRQSTENAGAGPHSLEQVEDLWQGPTVLGGPGGGLYLPAQPAREAVAAEERHLSFRNLLSTYPGSVDRPAQARRQVDGQDLGVVACQFAVEDNEVPLVSAARYT